MRLRERERERERAKLVGIVMMKAAGLTIYKWERKKASKNVGHVAYYICQLPPVEEIASSHFNTKLVSSLHIETKLIRYGLLW